MVPQKHQRANFPRIALKADEARKWDETMAACNWIGPGFIHIMYSMLVPRGRTMSALFTEAMPWMAATDGYQLIFKPSRFFQISLMRRVFVTFHEILHNVWDHCGSSYKARLRGTVTWNDITVPYIDELAGIIMDLIINDTLIQSKMGEFEPSGLHDTTIATYMDNWVEVYVRVYKKCEQQAKKQGKGQGQGGGGGGSGRGRRMTPEELEQAVQGIVEGRYLPSPDDDGQGGGKDGEPSCPRLGQFDMHLSPGQGGKTGEEIDQSEGPPERTEIEWQQAVAAGMAVAKAQGKLPRALELVFGEVLQPKVDWRDHIRALFARKVGSGGYSWQRLDRRLIVRNIGAPGRTGHGAKLVVVGGDNSGSIYADPTLLGRFLGEIGGILEDVNPEEIILVWCDAEVHEVDEITDPSDIALIQKRGSTGGGGTSFVPVFQYIEEKGLRPDVLVYLTDMMGTFPDDEPPYPVIWGSITEHAKPPFGDMVFIPTNEPDE